MRETIDIGNDFDLVERKEVGWKWGALGKQWCGAWEAGEESAEVYQTMSFLEDPIERPVPAAPPSLSRGKREPLSL